MIKFFVNDPLKIREAVCLCDAGINVTNVFYHNVNNLHIYIFYKIFML